MNAPKENERRAYGREAWVQWVNAAIGFTLGMAGRSTALIQTEISLIFWEFSADIHILMMMTPTDNALSAPDFA